MPLFLSRLRPFRHVPSHLVHLIPTRLKTIENRTDQIDRRHHHAALTLDKNSTRHIHAPSSSSSSLSSSSQIQLKWLKPPPKNTAPRTPASSPLALGRQNIHTIEADPTDTFRAGIALFQRGDGATGGAVDLHDAHRGADGAGVGVVGQGGGGHVEVAAGVSGFDGGFDGGEGFEAGVGWRWG